MVTNILANINIASTSTSTGTWATMTGMNVSSITVQGTNSVLILIAQVQIDPATDNAAEFRFNVNGSTTNSPVIMAFSDTSTNEEANSMTLYYAVTGLSGSSNTFDLEWRTVGSAASADTNRNRTFQILEIVGGDATIKVDSGIADQTADPGSWGNLFQSTGISIAGTSSVIIMLGNVPINPEADESTDFQFGVDNTGDGAVTTGFTDAANEANGWSGMHALSGLTGGTHSFELKWQARSGNGQTDGGRRRTFQVIEITASATLEINLNNSDTGTAPGTFGNVDGLSSSYTVDGTDAIVLTIANMVQAGDTSDASCDYSLGVDGTNEGAELISHSDSGTLAQRISMARLKTGLSAASHSFQLRWLEIAGATVADTGRARTLQVVEFTQVLSSESTKYSELVVYSVVESTKYSEIQVYVTYKLEGVTYDKDEVILGSVDCYLYKDNGDNTVTFKNHVVSNVSTGAYTFTGILDNDVAYFVVFIKDDTPHVMDVTDHVLQPVLE